MYSLLFVVVCVCMCECVDSFDNDVLLLFICMCALAEVLCFASGYGRLLKDDFSILDVSLRKVAVHLCFDLD